MTRARMTVLAVLLVSLALKIGLWCAFPDGLYHDAVKAISAGGQLLHDRASFTINSKTWIGPLLWHHAHQVLGVFGIKLVNLLLFAALAAAQLFIGRRHHREEPLALAMLLFCFYPGTNLNAVAGEPDDSLAALLFTLGVLVHLSRRSGLGAGLIMGCAVVIKFSAGILALGYVGLLLARREPRLALHAALGLLLPFAALNLLDGGLSLELLLSSLRMQGGFSSWGEVGFKLMSTGLLPLFAVSVWAWRSERSEANALALAVVGVYLGYVLIMRDAYAASFVMPPVVLLGSFLAARFLRHVSATGSEARRAVLLGAFIVCYLVAATAISGHNLSHDLEDARARLNPGSVATDLPAESSL